MTTRGMLARIAEIQRQLGHASLEVTSIYLAHIAPHDVIERMQKREWDSEGL